jgi:adenosylcobinamide-GDP ribazoletransferase
MRAGDVGPFGVVTLVLTLLLQAACLAELLAVDGGWLALPVAVVAARLVMARSGMPGVAIAEGSALGRSVAGTVSRRWLSAAVVVAAAATLGAALLVRDSLAQGGQLLVAATIGMLAAEALYRRARTRLGGVNGDVMGAMGEVTTAVTLLAAAVALT